VGVFWNTCTAFWPSSAVLMELRVGKYFFKLSKLNSMINLLIILNLNLFYQNFNIKARIKLNFYGGKWENLLNWGV
jgi:hypothetical protein